MGTFEFMSQTPQSSKRAAALFLGFAVLVVVGMAGYVGFGQLTSSGQERREQPPTPVTTADVREMEFARIIEAIGTARANESVELTAKVTDTLSALYFDSGDVVEKGEVIAALTDAQEAAELEEAQSSVREAELNYDRAQDLGRRGVESQARLDAARAALEQARARVTAIKARLEDRLITAPFDGVVGLRTLSDGALVQPGDVVATLDDVSVIKLDFAVPELFLGGLSMGQTIEAKTSAYDGETFQGDVASIDSRVDPATRTVTVRALIDNAVGHLRPGMLLTVDLVRDRRMALGLPETSVQRTQSTAFVFVVEEGGNGPVAKRREIEIGGRRPGFVEVAAGLDRGETVVVDGVHRVRDNGGVEIMGVSERATPPALAGGSNAAL